MNDLSHAESLAALSDPIDASVKVRIFFDQAPFIGKALPLQTFSDFLQITDRNFYLDLDHFPYPSSIPARSHPAG